LVPEPGMTQEQAGQSTAAGYGAGSYEGLEIIFISVIVLLMVAIFVPSLVRHIRHYRRKNKDG